MCVCVCVVKIENFLFRNYGLMPEHLLKIKKKRFMKKIKGTISVTLFIVNITRLVKRK